MSVSARAIVILMALGTIFMYALGFVFTCITGLLRRGMTWGPNSFGKFGGRNW